ncbi:glycosyltransferase family 2 protein [Rhodoferax sp.]|uniref:glycosyltransferase family 2 protein n=1 Tax=Rhodoferax sp. TaxID=50421 RepID=UPI002ACE26EC|nr:glycosyltransferase family 2 protein [Rhodoferax sp.]MDZ7918794.1 glycosyltransferase family 2 protein [Rhodoferax sp.]
MKVCVVVPVYNHGATVGAVVASLQAHGVHCIVVDDGSEPVCAAILHDLHVRAPANVGLVRMPHNGGKGAAVIAGMQAAWAQGFTHALQVDADGQHAMEDVPRFIALAQTLPDAVICGCPVYDNTVPKGRLYGRYLTHVWVWINTLSFDIRDSMCGFRVYPLANTVALLNEVRIGRRMDFDTEIIVRLYWRGVPVVNQPTRVRYPQGGISHFRALQDNVLISRMHAMLFLGMLCRAPALVMRKLRQRTG